jgi:S1-C subfamily serine protease
VVGLDYGRDVALIRFSPTGLAKSTPLQTRALSLGERGSTLYVLGYGGSGLNAGGTIGGPRISSGVFTQIIALGAPLGDNILSDVLVRGGYSGGPMLDAGGRVVGMVRATEEGFTYAVPVESIEEVLPRLKAGEIIR